MNNYHLYHKTKREKEASGPLDYYTDCDFLGSGCELLVGVSAKLQRRGFHEEFRTKDRDISILLPLQDAGDITTRHSKRTGEHVIRLWHPIHHLQRSEFCLMFVGTGTGIKKGWWICRRALDDRTPAS